MSGLSDLESRARPHQQNSLIPMMLSPPESLLVSCVLRGNFVEAHQVNEMHVFRFLNEIPASSAFSKHRASK